MLKSGEHFLKVIFYCFLSIGLAFTPVCAQNTDIGPDTYHKQANNNEWNYLIAFPMIWAPSIHGDINADTERVTIEVPFSNIIENLNFGMIGELYAQKGKWLYSLRLDYMRIKTSEETEGLVGPITGGVISPGHKFDIKLQMAANDLLVGYEAYPGLRILTGVRQIYAKVDLTISPLSNEGLVNISKNFNITHSNQFDWLVGATYRHWFSDDWGISAAFDTMIYGDSDRDVGFNVTAIYRFGELHNVWMGYRYLQIGNDSIDDSVAGSIKTEIDFIQHGPQLGWAFTF